MSKNDKKSPAKRTSRTTSSSGNVGTVNVGTANRNSGITFKRDKKLNFKSAASRSTFVSDKDVSYNLGGDLNTVLKSHLETELVKRMDPNNHELEFRIGTYSGDRFNAYISRLEFNRMIQHYHQKYKNSGMEENVSLDVVYDENFRVTVSGQTLNTSKNEIEFFCKTNKLRNPDFMEKIQIQKTDNHDWNYRLTSSSESRITDENQRLKLVQAIEDKTISKFYRYKYRYSYPVGQVRVDFTVVKETPPGGLAGTLVSSRTLAQKEKYQVEMEYQGKSFTIQNLQTALLPALNDLILHYSGTKGSTIPISQSHSNLVISRYLELGLKEKLSLEMIHQKPSTNKFLAMDVEALTRQNFSLIQHDYMVTVKADGEHYLLYLNSELGGQTDSGSYLINNRLNISPVQLNMIDGDQSKLLKEMGQCIYDGELVEHNGKYRFLIFDCFFYQGKDVRDLPLYNKTGGKYLPTDKSRMFYIKELTKSIKNEILSDQLVVEEKTYYPIDKVSRFFKRVGGESGERYVLKDDETPYNIDGLIYMKVNESYPKIVYQSGRLIKKGSLDDPENISPILKWKPPEFLSIDFRVTFDPSNPKIEKINGQDYMLMTIESAYGNKIHQFEPSCYRVKDYNKLYMPLTKGQPQLIEREGYRVEEETLGHVIRNRDILEFVWIPDRSFGTDFWGIWFPIKYREDKTQNGYPNNYRKVADPTWMAIHDSQVLPDNLMDPFGQNIPSPQLNMGYYQNQNRESLPDLRNIHNAIKSILIFLAVKQSGNKSRRLLDLATGRGGDLMKWTGINYAFGIEFDEGNLKAGDASAFSRYRGMLENAFMNDRRPPFTLDLIQGDMTELFSDGKVSQEKTFNYLIREKLGNHPTSFGVVSCQFAMHYACGSEIHLDNFMRNVSENLAPNGFFIATTFDGEKILNALQHTKETDEDGQPIIVGKNSKGQIMWSIASPVKYRTLENVGQKVVVFNKTIKDEEELEYLVNFKYVTQVAQKYQLYPGRLSFGKYNLPLDGSYGHGSFTDAYDEEFLKMIGETVYAKGSPRYRELEKSFQQIAADIKRYSKFSSFLILRKQA